MFLFAATIGILFPVIPSYGSDRKCQPYIYLAFFIALLLLYCFYKYVLLFSIPGFLDEPTLPSLPWITILIYFTGPLLYWYVRSTLKIDTRLRKKDIWHLLPLMVIFLISLYQRIYINHGEYISASGVLMNPYNLFINGFFDGINSVSLFYLSPPILISSYTFFSAGIFIHSLRQREMTSDSFLYLYTTISLGFLLGFLLMLVVGQAILLMYFKVEGPNAYYILNILKILSGLEVAGLFITPFFFQGIPYHISWLPEPGAALNRISESDSPCEEDNNSHNPVLESDYLLSIGEKAEYCMKEFQPYLHANFTLAQLAVMIQVPVHHLACYFRKEKKQSFQDYRNEWRIEHAKALMKEGLADGITLEAIGYLSGFLNRDAFRTTFRKREGILPSEFALKTKK